MNWIKRLQQFLSWSAKDKDDPQDSEEKQPPPAPQSVDLSFSGEAAPLDPLQDLLNSLTSGLDPLEPSLSPYEEVLKIIEQAIKDGTTKLDLSNKRLTWLPPEIGQLTNLVTLDLWWNQLSTLPSQIGKLTNLIGLCLSNNQLSTWPPEIGQLTNLTTLYLERNQLSTLPPEIGKLINLTALNFERNQLSTLPPEIGKLINLTTLNFERNQLSTLPPEIGKLINLTTLNFKRNQLSTLLPEIGQLTKLTSLILSHNQIWKLPPEIGQLTNLTILDLSGNQLFTLPPEIGQLTNLTILDLSGNQLLTLSLEIGQLTNLTNLTELDLTATKLLTLPPEIGQLTNLTTLSLQGNELSRLPPEIEALENLTRLDLRDNPLPIPPEILKRTDEPATILDYYFRDNQPLNEAKLVLVGQGRVGKTSLVKRLVEGGFDEQEAITEGIAIKGWGVEEIRVNIWDFGGQEIMHATHEFFLTTRTLYVLVLDGQQDEAENRLEYWLRLIEGFGKGSPVIVVRNKIDLEQRLDLDPNTLRKRYPSINLKAFVVTSCQRGWGIAKLEGEIRRLIDEMPHVRDLIPVEWLEIKGELAGLGRNYIGYQEFVDLCEARGIGEQQEQRVLIRLLHDLGVVLHFADDPELSKTIVLNPEWVTGAIYRIINAKSLQNRGVLAIGQLDEIFAEVAELYPQERYLLLMEMMRRFERCFDLEGYVGERFLIPDLLPSEEATFFWPDDSLKFEYHYNFLPSSILSRFMVQMHGFIDERYCWRSGVALVRDKTNALVRQQESKIAISVIGHKKDQFLSDIRERFERIHQTLRNLQAKEHLCHADVPVACDLLAQLQQKGIRYYELESAKGEFITIEVNKLWAEVSPIAFGQERKVERWLDELNEWAHPQVTYKTAFAHGQEWYQMGGYSDARQALAKAHQALRNLRGMKAGDRALVHLSEGSAKLYGMLVDCCVQEGSLAEPNVNKAFEYAAVGKGRAFVNQLAQTRFDFERIGNQKQFVEQYEQVRDLRAQIEALDDNQRGEQYKLYQQEVKLWEQMERHYPVLTATLRVPILSAEAAQELAKRLGATLVEYYRHALGWCAFVVTPDEIRYVPLPALKKRLLNRLIEWRNDVDVPAGRTPLGDKYLERLYKAAIAPLKLNNQRVIIAPFERLHLLPLAAAYNAPQKRYFAEECLLSFVPSLTALYVVNQQQKDHGDSKIERLLTVAYPGEEGAEGYLPNVLDEAQAIIARIANVAEVTPLLKEAATREKVLAEAPDYDIIHFGCHGRFDSERPSESGLMLADEALTVQQIITHLKLKRTRLVTLAACLSGQVALREGEEHVGLLQAMMTAGGQTVVASLWEVDDAATHALFGAFYTRVGTPNAPAQAMCDAAALLRRYEKWKHPFYWAAFQVNGLTPFLAAKAATPASPSRLLAPSPHRDIAETWPSDLLRQIDEDYKRSFPRGTIMNEQKFLKNAQVLYRNMLFAAPEETLAALKQDQRLQKMADIQLEDEDEKSQLRLAVAIHQIVLNNPTLQQLFLPSERDVRQLRTQLQKERRRVKSSHHQDEDFSRLQDEEIGVENDMPTVRSLIINRLEEEIISPQANDEEPESAESLWKRLLSIFTSRNK